MNGFDCGPVAIAVALQIFKDGFSEDNMLVIQGVAESCHHITRLEVLQSIKNEVTRSMEDYIYFRSHPPDEWLSLSLALELGDFNPLSEDELQKKRTLLSSREPIQQQLNVVVSGCLDCTARFRKEPSNEPLDMPEEDPARDRSDSPGLLFREVVVKPQEELPDDGEDVFQEEPSEDFDILRTRRLHTLNIDWNKMSIERRRRVSRPCDLLLPTRPLWPSHDPHFDDYYGGPTQEDKRAFEDPLYLLPMNPTAGLTIKSCWTYFRDYGYRILTRFAHSFYLCDPMMLENHIMPCIPEFNPESSSRHFLDMHLIPRNIGRTGIPELRMAKSSDVEIMGAKEMLERVMKGDKQDDDLLLSYFVRGKTENAKYVCVDLERDSISHSEIKVTSTVDIDSFVWVTHVAEVGAPVGLMVTPSLRNNAGIRKHNHVYVEILEPPSDDEATGRKWLERRIPLSNIPHTLFTKVTEGNSPIYCYIFFPRMMHRHEYTGRRATIIPIAVLLLFWDRVVLKALQDVVHQTMVEPFYEFSVDEYLRKSSGKRGSKDSLYSGHCKQIDPNTFLSLQTRMMEIISDHDDTGLMDRFKSFFFVFECKGFKLNVISRDGGSVLDMLKLTVPQMSWDYALKRKNGEMYLDIAFTHQPIRKFKNHDDNKSGVLGLWKLDYLENSFGKGGYRAGTTHNINTLSRFGAIQAEMTLERSRRTHVGFRSSYNLLYEAVRKKDNDPWFCGDGDAYNLNEDFIKACDEKKKQYSRRGGRSYGVRDEYRVSGVAAKEILSNSKDVVRSSPSAIQFLA
jgi:hypothetical protein